MIGVDTNILVRLLTNDDPKQARYAAALFEKNAIFIAKSVLLETEWVLRFTYNLSAGVILNSFEKLMGLSRVTVEEPICVARALLWYSKGLDFADALHLASSQKAEKFATFDKKLVKRAAKLGVNLITV